MAFRGKMVEMGLQGLLGFLEFVGQRVPWDHKGHRDEMGLKGLPGILGVGDPRDQWDPRGKREIRVIQGTPGQLVHRGILVCVENRGLWAQTVQLPISLLGVSCSGPEGLRSPLGGHGFHSTQVRSISGNGSGLNLGGRSTTRSVSCSPVTR